MTEAGKVIIEVIEAVDVHSFCSFVPSFVRSFRRSFVRSFVRSFRRSVVRSFRRSFVPSFRRASLCSFRHLSLCLSRLSFVPSLVCPFVRSFVRPSICDVHPLGREVLRSLAAVGFVGNSSWVDFCCSGVVRMRYVCFGVFSVAD